MDLEAATRDFFAALNAGRADEVIALLAPDAVAEVPGVLPPIGLAKLDPMLRRFVAAKNPIKIGLMAMKVKRNVAFTGWRAQGDMPSAFTGIAGGGALEGLAVLHWDRDGKISRLDVHLGEDVAKNLKP